MLLSCSPSFCIGALGYRLSVEEKGDDGREILGWFSRTSLTSENGVDLNRINQVSLENTEGGGASPALDLQESSHVKSGEVSGFKAEPSATN